MQGHTIKYARGSVWLCRDDLEINDKPFGFRPTSHVQRKTRPVLIISNDIGNARSPVVNVLPLTSQDKRSSVAVPICNEDGVLSCILCNQIKTIDKAQLIKYEFMIDAETMSEVEKILQHALGIKLNSIDSSLDDIKATIDNIVTMKFNKISTRQEFDSIVEHVARGLEETYSKLINEYIGNIKSAEERIVAESQLLHTVTKNNNNDKDNLNETVDIKSKSKKDKPEHKSRGFWTLDMKRQFINDFDTKSINYIMEVYGFENESKTKKRYYNYKSELRLAGLLNK